MLEDVGAAAMKLRKEHDAQRAPIGTAAVSRAHSNIAHTVRLEAAPPKAHAFNTKYYADFMPCHSALAERPSPSPARADDDRR